MNRILGILGLAVLVLSGAACDDGPPQSATDFKSPPYTRGIEVGRTYNYSLTTHCGIRHTRIDGTAWKATPPLTDRNGNPPKAWDNPVAIGKLRIVNADKAVFTVGDLSATFVRADVPETPCG